MNILLGVGNTLRCDDGAGIYVAENLQHPWWKTYDCGTAPENFTGVIRREHPKVLLIVDAADMGLCPGEFRKIAVNKIGISGFDTHQMDLAKVIHFMEGMAGEIILIGIQPETTAYGDFLSETVLSGAERLIGMIKSDCRSVPEI